MSKTAPATMEEVIDRLRESKQADEHQLAKEGRKCGERWVREVAEFAEIRRLEKYVDSVQKNERCSLFETGKGDAYSADEHLVFKIQPENDGDREAASEFWRALCEDDWEIVYFTSQPQFLEGFSDGALDLWNSIKDKV